MAATTATSPVSVTRIPNPDEPVPAISVPGVLLFLGALALWFGSTALALADVWPWWLSVLPSAVASYLLFTVAHDTSHRSFSTSEAANVWFGRVGTLFFAPHASFGVWRFIHMQHHRFTNHDDGRDPDHYTMAGPAWQRLFRLLTIDLYYMVFYLPRIGSRPRAEKVELAATWAVSLGLLAAAIATGHLADYLLLYLLPLRLAILWLGFAFDWLPHHGLHLKPSEDKAKTTRNRVGYERLVSPLLLYQNYHLVHHLHPIVPFHRYLQVWRRNEEAYLAADPELTDLRGRPITPDEYRRMRELVEHH
jgi:ring-1,2-phenylacetyl-CoA epoxidase subunit PaaE